MSACPSAGFEQLICDGLSEPGWVVVPDFLDRGTTTAIEAMLRTRWESGALRPAGIGRGRTFQVRPEIRSDQVLWVDNEAPPAPLEAYLQRMEGLRRVLNEQLFLGLHEYECHLTTYPRGSFYRRHLDQFADQARRQISTIFYLNPNWRETDGGALRIETDQGIHSVLPEAGTLVAFRAADFWHEVRRARRLRLSVTGWYLSRPLLP
ncbi:MAG: 2OG-Fe(II) oxygenase [Gammaproteobacteria bacterium]|nr:2OG-Fe(II) oxygenase [Gammaproteobacteria bacterium]